MVREAYFDAPNLGRLIQDVWNNPGFVSPGASKLYHRDVALDRHLPDCEDILKEVIWAFSDFVRDNRGVYDPEARYPAGNPWYPVTGQF